MGADVWGIADGFHNGANEWVPTAFETQEKIRASLHAYGEPPVSTATVVLYPNDRYLITEPSLLSFEDGSDREIEPGEIVGSELPTGYHDLTRKHSGITTRLIVTPGACVLDESMRTWGWAIQLYATRSSNSWGIGDFRDLRVLNDWAANQLNAGMVLINPLHAAGPILSQQPSPYFPTSRVYRNPLYLCMEHVPGYAEHAAELAEFAEAGRALNASRAIDRDAVFTAKMGVLETLWKSWPERPASERDAFSGYVAEEGTALHHFATYCALMEVHRDNWASWPEQYRRPTNPAVEEFRTDPANQQRVQFHTWVQWLIDEQLRTAGTSLDLMTDLAIGVDRGGADAWIWQDSFALDMSVGAPPDEFNTQGQNWGLPPFDPWKLRENRFEAFIRTVRSAFRHAGSVRIDHVMGLFRLYWIPSDVSAKEGGYVYLPFRELLGIISLESQRSGAYVVGEDLGTIEEYVRTELANARIMSYKLSQFESVPAEQFPVRALAAVTTHDLPTIPGCLTGFDLRAQTSIGLVANVEGSLRLREALAHRAGFVGLPSGDKAEETTREMVTEIVRGVYRELATSPCQIVTATLDDPLGVEERPNMPGTIDEWPNWRIALPFTIEEIMEHPEVAAVAFELSRRTS